MTRGKSWVRDIGGGFRACANASVAHGDTASRSPRGRRVAAADGRIYVGGIDAVPGLLRSYAADVGGQEVARRFACSPAFAMDGVDLFGGGTTGGSIACRVYSTQDGLRSVPTLRDLCRALKEQVARATRV